MPQVNSYPAGAFCWIELATTNLDAAKRFYGEVFGWTFQDNPIGEMGVYTMFSKGGLEVAGGYQLPKELLAQGLRPNWLPYVSVGDVEAVARWVQELGGQVIDGPMDVFEEGRMVLFQDPTGARLAAWEPRKHIGARLAGENGTRVWSELLTKDVETARSFYAELFGWTPKTQTMGEVVYTVFHLGEQMMGGLMAMPKEVGDAPPHWMNYFAVEDCEASAALCQKLGAQLLVGPEDIPDVGRFATFLDPQGAAFSLIAPPKQETK